MATPVFTPQAYQPIYTSINGEAQSFITGVEIDFESNASKVATVMRQLSGVVQGASETNFTLHQVIPFAPTDAAGSGMGVKGSTAAGQQLINTMITTINTNGSTPCAFGFGIGGLGGNGLPNTQNLFLGFILKASVSYSVSGIPMVTYVGVGQLVPWT